MMEVRGSYAFEAPAQAVWDLLVDAEAVAACLPGCDTLDPIGEHRYRAVLTMGIAAVTGRYEGTVEMTDLDPPHAYRLVVDGKGTPGFVTGGGTITLTETAGRTQVTVAGSVQVGGTIARVGQRLLGGVSKLMMDRFFTCMQKRLASGSTAAG